MFNLRVALCRFGYDGRIELLPESEKPNLLARIRLGTPREPTVDEMILFNAVRKRHTNRQPFACRKLPQELVEALRAAAEQEGAWLHFATDEERSLLVDLVWEADRLQWADKQFRTELAAWIWPNLSGRRDGIPGYALGRDSVMSVAAPAVVRNLDLGKSVSEKDRALALESPALVLLGTDEDGPRDWLNAGQALERVLLRAAADGVSASFFNQPLEISELRPQLRAAVVETGFPQLMMRLGYGPAVPPTPRRNVRDVTRSAPAARHP